MTTPGTGSGSSGGESGLRVEFQVHFERGGRGRKGLRPGHDAVDRSAASAPRVPRISRLMALAIRFEDLVRRGEVEDYADIARLGHVTRARVSQIMNLANLAPDLQAALLELPPITRERETVHEHVVRPIAAEPDWRVQRRMWRRVAARLPTLGGAVPTSSSVK